MTDVCKNQDTFNNALSKGIKKYEEDKNKGKSVAVAIFSFIFYLVFAIWGVMLAARAKDTTLHVALALTLGPVYVLSYYVAERL